MICPKCGSSNVSTQIVNEMQLKNKHHGVIWWVLIGWWWFPIKWLVFTVPALIIKIFGHRKQKIVNKQKTVSVCQNCGNTWNV